MNNPNGESSRRFQILSLDGGGIRGVFTAAVLAAIEEDCRTRIVDHFDLLAGTSTGGILAIGLGLGFSPMEMVEFYVQLGPQIFRRSSLQLLSPKYASEPLAKALKNKFGERPFGASAKRLVIPSFNLGDNEVYVFRTAHLERLRRDCRVPASHVAMATSAAPTYFPVHRMPDGIRLVDGGVWANNPSMVALTEVVGQGHLGLSLDDVHLLSLGTVGAVYGRRNHLDRGGFVAWRKAAFNVVLDASSIGVSNQAKALLGERFLRVNAQGMEDEVRLDNVRSVHDLIARARAASRTAMPEIESRFLNHHAEPFSPFHTM